MSRVVVITGSTRGLGLELARACAARGERVVIHGRDPARVAELAASLGVAGFAVDLAVEPEALIAQVLATHGRIDVLVNNAAVSPRRLPLWEAAQDALDAALAINVRAPLRCTRAVLGWAIPAGAHVRIVNVGSAIASAPREHATGYATTKAALEGFTRALALDTGARATITAVALGGHRTALAGAMLDEAEHARLPPAEAAVPLLLHAMTASAELVHGRVLEERGPVLDVAALDLFAHLLGPSPRARAALAEAARGPLDRYPEPDHAELRKLLAAHHGVPLAAIVLGGGISELLDRVLRVVTRPGEAVIAHAPSWPGVPTVLHTRGLAWRRVAYRLEGHADHDLDAIARALDPAVRAIYLTSPGNPGARALDAAPFERFLDRLPPHITVIVDEAYGDVATRAEALAAAKLVSWRDQLVVLRSFSKLYGLAGLRIGYAIAAPERARALARSAPAFPLVRGAAEAACAAIADHAHTRRAIADVIAARTRLEAELDRRGHARLASDAPFVLAEVPGVTGPRVFDRYVMLPAWAEMP